MGKDKLDRAVKSKLYDLHTPIDTNDLWAGIESKMEYDEATPTPGFSFRKYLGLGVLAMLLMGSLYVTQSYMSSDVQDISESDVSISPTIEKGNNASANVATAPKQSTSTKANINLNNSNDRATTEETRSSEKRSTSNNYTSTNIIQSETNNIATTTNTTSQFSNNTTSTNNNASSSNQNANNNINGLAENNTVLEKPISERPDQGQVAEGENFGNNGTGGTGTNNIYESAQNKNNKNIPGVGHDNQDAIAGSTTTKEAAVNSIMTPLVALNNAPSLEHKTDVRDICDELKGDACSGAFRMRNRVDCYDNWNGDRSNFSIVPYVGIDFVTNDRSRTETGEPDEYLLTRESTMQFLEVLKAGALVKYNVTPNVYVKAGVEYDQIREKFESTLVTTDVTFDPQAIIAYRIDMEGDTIPVLGPGTMQVIRTTVWKKYNKYHSFNIPVIIGYEAPISKRWDYFGEAGIFYNVRFSYEGTLLDPNNEVVSGENYFLNQTGVSLYGAAGARFNVNKRWSVFTNASYKYNLASINNQDFNPIRQNLGLAGISIGAEIRL